MANRWVAGMASIGCAAVIAACGGSDDQREDTAVQDRMARAPQQVTLTGCVQTGQLETEYVLRNVRTEGGQQSPQKRPGQPQPPQQPDQAQPTQQAQRTEQREARAGQQQAQGQPQTDPSVPDASRLPARTDDYGITPYSFVQLQAQSPADLRQYVGQEVRVTGTMTDTGKNTIGTAGTAGTHEVPSGDTSAAGATELSPAEKKKAEAGRIARESMSNSTAPIVRVENITPTGEKCRDMPAPINPREQN